MSVIKLSQTSAIALTVTGLSTLGSGSYATSNTVDNTANLYLDYLIELNITVGTVSGNKQYVIFAISSVDGSNFSDTSQDANMVLLGAVQTPTNATGYRSPSISVSAAFGGTLPPKFEIVVKNDSGAAFTAGTAQYVGSYQTVI